MALRPNERIEIPLFGVVGPGTTTRTLSPAIVGALIGGKTPRAYSFVVEDLEVSLRCSCGTKLISKNDLARFDANDEGPLASHIRAHESRHQKDDEST